MNIWRHVRGLSFRQIFRLSWIALQNPLLIFPTLKATKKTMVICDRLYGKVHHKNGKANAFRHGLWNVLICNSTFRITKNKEKSKIWTQKITDLHEKLAPNEPLDTAMDLHNNEIGRQYFLKLNTRSEEEIISFLKVHTQKAKKIKDIKTILDHKNELIYLSEDN